MKFDLSKIKVAIFDFDETLALHDDSDFVINRSKTEEKYQDYYINAYMNPNDFFETIEPCKSIDEIKKLIDILRNNNVKLYCMSGLSYSFHYKAKEVFVHKYYGKDIELIATASQERKVDGVKILRRLNNCSLDEILFVDDMEDNIQRFKNLGINAVFPEEIKDVIKEIKDNL